MKNQRGEDPGSAPPASAEPGGHPAAHHPRHLPDLSGEGRRLRGRSAAEQHPPKRDRNGISIRSRPAHRPRPARSRTSDEKSTRIRPLGAADASPLAAEHPHPARANAVLHAGRYEPSRGHLTGDRPAHHPRREPAKTPSRAPAAPIIDRRAATSRTGARTANAHLRTPAKPGPQPLPRTPG